MGRRPMYVQAPPCSPTSGEQNATKSKVPDGKKRARDCTLDAALHSVHSGEVLTRAWPAEKPIARGALTRFQSPASNASWQPGRATVQESQFRSPRGPPAGESISRNNTSRAGSRGVPFRLRVSCGQAELTSRRCGCVDVCVGAPRATPSDTAAWAGRALAPHTTQRLR